MVTFNLENIIESAKKITKNIKYKTYKLHEYIINTQNQTTKQTYLLKKPTNVIKYTTEAMIKVSNVMFPYKENPIFKKQYKKQKTVPMNYKNKHK